MSRSSKGSNRFRRHQHHWSKHYTTVGGVVLRCVCGGLIRARMEDLGDHSHYFVDVADDGGHELEARDYDRLCLLAEELAGRPLWLAGLSVCAAG